MTEGDCGVGPKKGKYLGGEGKYSRGKAVGDGTFSIVHHGRFLGERDEFNAVAAAKTGVVVSDSSEMIVALKRFKHGSGSEEAAKREIKALSRLEEVYPGHKNLIPLLDIVGDGGRKMLVLPMCRWDLDVVISDCEACLPLSEVKYYTRGILSALHACHGAGIIHRDVKPNNILIDSRNAVLLADFGSSEWMADTAVGKCPDNLALQVGTTWYRSPDLLFGNRAYGSSLDMWSAGCLIGEMIKRKPLFPGTGEIDQLAKIFHVLGTPTLANWPTMKSMPFFMQFKASTRLSLVEFLSRRDCIVDEELESLVSGLLEFDPFKRLSASEALSCSWFESEPLEIRPENLEEPRPKTERLSDNASDSSLEFESGRIDHEMNGFF